MTTKTLMDYVRETQARYRNASRGEVERGLGFGLCRNCTHGEDIPTRRLRDEVRALVDSITQKWPKYSGNPAYPVPDPECAYKAEHLRAEAAARAYDQAVSKGMYSGKYGKLRMQLAAFIADGLEEHMKRVEGECE